MRAAFFAHPEGSASALDGLLARAAGADLLVAIGPLGGALGPAAPLRARLVEVPALVLDHGSAYRPSLRVGRHHVAIARRRRDATAAPADVVVVSGGRPRVERRPDGALVVYTGRLALTEAPAFAWLELGAEVRAAVEPLPAALSAWIGEAREPVGQRLLEAALHRLASGPPPSPAHTGPALTSALVGPRVATLFVELLHPNPDRVAHVHAARVATRRLREALAAVAPLYRTAVADEAVRRIAFWTHKLGRARTADVLARLAEVELGEHAEPLTRRLAARRRRATTALEHHRRWLREEAAWLVDFCRRPARPEPSLRALGVAHVEARMRRVIARRPALLEPAATEAHHEVRILTKQLRYAVELVGAPLDLPPSILPALRRAQDALGDAHDLDELARLAADRVGGSPGGHRALTELRGRAAERARLAVEEADLALGAALETLDRALDPHRPAVGPRGRPPATGRRMGEGR